MFDLNADDGSTRKKPYKSPIPDGADPRPMAGNRLNSQKMVAFHHRLLDLYTRELDRQYENRCQQAEDEDFYDNIQWSEQDAQVLRDRGQVPLVYNVISASIDWITGTEKRTRSDFKVLPRRKEHSGPAQRKTELLKYLSDVNRGPFDTSRAFEDTAKVGVGWLEDGVQDEDEDEPIYGSYESWRNMLWDSAAIQPDLSDARYCFRSRWVDLDIACALFRKRKSIVKQAAVDSDDFMAMDLYGDEAMDSLELEAEQSAQSSSDRIQGYTRERVRLIEGWIRIPVETQRLAGGNFSGELYDPHSPGHREDLEHGEAELVTKMTMRMHVAIFTTAGLLWFSTSPYRHNRFPFTPIWGYLRGRDRMPYGMIRRIKDIQQDVNKRASKALHILSTNKVIMDEDALPEDMTVDDFLEEISRPDAVIRKKAGKELTIDADRDLSQWHLELMSRSIAMIQQASGVTDELLGRRTNAASGIAIQRRQDQGSLATAKLFDNLLYANQVRGEKQLSLIEQFISEPKAIRITNRREQPEFIEINDGLPENDITRSKADFIISESDWHATQRQAAVDALLEAIAKFPPQVGLVLIDLVVENMDLPNREEIVRRIRGLTGQSDPDADEPSEEDIARQQQQDLQAQLQLEDAQTELRKKRAEAAKLEAQVADLEAKTIGSRVDAQQKSLAAAREALLVPETTHVADHILAESGFVAASDRQPPAEGPIGLGQQPSPPQPPVQGAGVPAPQQPGLMPA